MSNWLRIPLILLAIYIALGFIFDAYVGYAQPQAENTLVIQIHDSEGALKDTVLTARDDGDQLWVESGHWFRGWYRRMLDNPKVYIIRHDKKQPYTAVPIDTPEALENMLGLMGKGKGVRYWIGRTLLLYAPIKPVRLDEGH